jgi:RNAse (barnase) inhibitor barstar
MKIPPRLSDTYNDLMLQKEDAAWRSILFFWCLHPRGSSEHKMNFGPPPPSGKDPFARIRGLMCYSTVLSLIQQGSPATEIADYIQQDVGECVDIGSEHLTDLLQKFIRGAHYQDKMASELDTLEREVSSKVEVPVTVYLSHLTFDQLLAGRAEAPINIERQMAQAIHLQEHRIAEMINRERQAGISSRDVRREFETYVGMLVHLDTHRRHNLHSGTLSVQASSSSPVLEDGSREDTKPPDPARATFLLNVLNKIRSASPDVTQQLVRISNAVIDGSTPEDAVLIVEESDQPTSPPPPALDEGMSDEP